LSIHGYNHPNNSVKGLAKASNLLTLTIDGAVFDQIMDMYITRGIPQTLSTLRASLPWDVSQQLLTSFLRLPNNPLRSISLSDGSAFDPQHVLPELALPNLRDLAGPFHFVRTIVEGRAGMESICFTHAVLSADEFQRVTRNVASASYATLRKLAFGTVIVSGAHMEAIATSLPNLEVLAIEYNSALPGFWTARGIPFVRRLPKLTRITLIPRDPEGTTLGLHQKDFPLEMLGDDIPRAWESVCPGLRSIILTTKWAWRWLGVKFWTRESLLGDSQWREAAFGL